MSQILMRLLDLLARKTNTCNIDIDVKKLPHSFEHETFLAGRSKGKEKIHIGDPAYESLLALLANNKSGWCGDSTTYVPVDVYRSSYILVNLMENLIIINRRMQTGGWQQISRKIGK